MKRLFAISLALILLLCACGQKPAEDTTVPTLAAVTTEETLKAALEAGGRVVLESNIALSSHAVVQGHLLDGGGFTLIGPEHVEGNVTTENGITMTGGTVENITIRGAYRGIGDLSDYGASADIHINNVTVDSDTYALNFGYGTGMSGMYVTGSTFNGWSSYTKFNKVNFTDCTFGWSESGKQGTLRPYVETTLTDCKFEGKTDEDGTQVPFNISFKDGTSGITLILQDCYVGETLVTQENLNDLLNVNLANNTIQVRNS